LRNYIQFYRTYLVLHVCHLFLSSVFVTVVIVYSIFILRRRSQRDLIIQRDVTVKKDNDTVHRSPLFSFTKDRHSPFAPCVVKVVSEREWAHFIFQMASGR